MLRVLGLRHTTLADVLALHALSFSLPGILVGLCAASLLNLAVVSALQSLANITAPKTMASSAWVLGTVLGACRARAHASPAVDHS